MNDQAKDLSGALKAYDAVPAGTRFPAFTSAIDQALQSHCHASTDVLGDAFADLADVSIFAMDVSRAIANSGLPNDGRVQVRHRILQAGRVQLDEELTVEAEVGAYVDRPRGRHMSCHAAFRRKNRTVPLRMMTEHLLPYETVPSPENRTSQKRPDPREGMQEVGRVQMTPDKVTGYGEDMGNIIHSDPEFAQARGYRAPIAVGLMQLTALHGAIAEQALPWEMDLEIRFLRPVFWDEDLTLLADQAGELFRCVTADGRLTAEAKLRHLTTVDMEP